MKINEVIVVEGKTDTQLLKKYFEVDTIETGGSAINQNVLEYIRTISKTRDIIVMTDPDYPGMQIRNAITKIVPNCKHAFVKKENAIKNHKVGVAEASKAAIMEALENVVTFKENNQSISWNEFIDLNIIGNKERRLTVYRAFHLGYGNVKTLFKRLNLAGISYKQVKEILGE